MSRGTVDSKTTAQMLIIACFKTHNSYGSETSMAV